MAQKKKSGSSPKAPAQQPTPVSPEAIFRNATAFESVALSLCSEVFAGLLKLPNNEIVIKPGHSGEKVMKTFITHTVNSAFATELYLKCLLLESTGKMPWGHDLEALYDAVPATLQATIAKYYRDAAMASLKGRAVAKGAEPVGDIKHTLAKQRNAFADARYIFEGKEVLYEISHSGANGAIRRVILDLRPQWSKHADGLNT